MKSYTAYVVTRISGTTRVLTVNVSADCQMDAMKAGLAWAERRDVRGIISLEIERA